jgi:predicted deacylase
MLKTRTKYYIVGIIAVIILLVLIFSFISNLNEKQLPEEDSFVTEEVLENEEPFLSYVVGSSVLNRDIEVYEFGKSSEEEKHVIFVGGIHGGYEWNTVLLAWEFIDYLNENPDFIPDGVKVSIVPSLNPDGVYRVIENATERFEAVDVPPLEMTLIGRLNANEVDLNRNFDCNWQPESTWRNEIVDAGSEAFSEPEAKAIKDLVDSKDPVAVVFWHSAAGAVYGSECNDGVLPDTVGIMNAYASAAGYSAVESFDHYEITGDAEGWLASIGVPSITVELTNHQDLDWEKNLAGMKAVLQYFDDLGI